jgi:hypothetical protein
MAAAPSHPELQPKLSTLEQETVLARGFAQPCAAAGNPCADYGTARSRGESLPWPRPQTSGGCMVNLILLNTQPVSLLKYHATVRVPVACQCPNVINATRLFVATQAPTVEMHLLPEAGGTGFRIARWTGLIEAFSTDVLALNCRCGLCFPLLQHHCSLHNR